MRRFGVLGSVGILLALVACGSSYSSADSPASDAGVDANATAPGDDGGNLQVSDGNEAGVVPTPPACTERVADPDTGVFVRVDTGADSDTCGAVDVPCKSIGQGITRAAALARANVYVGAGVYPETITLAQSMTVSGGWTVAGTSWTPDCGANNTTTVKLQATANAAIRVKSGTAGIGYMTIQSKALAAASESLYGVIAGSGVTLGITDVAMTIAAGGVGGPGSPPISAVGPAPSSCATGNGSTASPGTPGAAGAAGTFDPTGFVTASGQQGGSGLAGGNGTAGGTAPMISAEMCSAVCSLLGYTVVGNAGANGCGGGGGAGGGGGHGGGSSIGVYAAPTATVAVSRSTIAVGNGGNGGDGATGVIGGSGSKGAAGASKTYTSAESCDGTSVQSVSTNAAPPPSCPNALAMLPGGFAGGTGGNGGSGGQGGGGAGGWSVAFAAASNATISASADTTVTVGTPGSGGAPNGGAGTAAPRTP